MLQGLRTAIYHVADIAQAKAWYTKVLGYEPYFDEPFYVGFDVGGYELGLLPRKDTDNSASSVVAYWGVEDIDSAFAELIQTGAVEQEPVTEVGGNIKVAAVRDPLGNTFGIIENPNFSLK